MKIGDFIKQCGKGINDPSLIVVKPMEWFDIINFQVDELLPDIAFEGTLTIAWNDNYELDLSSYAYIGEVKEVSLEDSDGKVDFYDNWIFDTDRKLLDLQPESSKVNNLDPDNYVNVLITWSGYSTESTKFDDLITLSKDKIVLLKKICIKEALRRILLDHIKLDRYRVLTGRADEYRLIAIMRELTTEIEIAKRKGTNTNPVRSF